jgi:hypothetical protein
MEFVDNIIEIINNHDNRKIKYIMPIQLIIFEYIYSTCYDCNALLKHEIYKCGYCGITRCKFHHVVCALWDYCVSCETHYVHLHKYRMLVCDYECNFCNRNAEYGLVNDVLYCSDHIPLVDNIIRFDKECSIKCNNKWTMEEYHSECEYHCNNCKRLDDVCKFTCCGRGYFRHKVTKEALCLKHKNMYDVNEIEYNYLT